MTIDGGATTIEVAKQMNFSASAKFNDGNFLYIGTHNDLRLYHDGSNSYISDTGTGDLYIQGESNIFLGSSSETYFKGIKDDAVLLYFNNVAKLATRTDGVNVIGELECDSLDVDGNADISGNLTVTGTTAGIVPKIYGNVIKLIPSDFMDNGDGGNTKFGVAYTDVAGTGYGMRPANNATELYAFVSIPEGMKATHVDIFDKNNLAIEVFEANINATTMTSKGTGNCNTTLDITDVNSTATNFLAIEVTTTSVNDRVYGGQVTIAAI